MSDIAQQRLHRLEARLDQQVRLIDEQAVAIAQLRSDLGESESKVEVLTTRVSDLEAQLAEWEQNGADCWEEPTEAESHNIYDDGSGSSQGAEAPIAAEYEGTNWPDVGTQQGQDGQHIGFQHDQ